MKKTRIRKLTVLIAPVLVVVGLVLHVGMGTLSSFGWQDIAYLCPLGSLEVLLAERALIPRVVVAFLCVLLVAALVGRVFCGWICPVPPLQRFFFGKRPRGFGAGSGTDGAPAAEPGVEVAPAVEPGAEVAPAAEPGVGVAPVVEPDVEVAPVAEPGAGDVPATEPGAEALSGCPVPAAGGRAPARRFGGVRLDSRHGVLAGALVSSLIFGFPVFCLVCPVGLTLGLIVVLWHLFTEAQVNLLLVYIPLVLVVELAFLRKWCHRFCPLGALMSLLSVPNRLLRPSVDMDKCLRHRGVPCSVCSKSCGEGLDPHFDLHMHECTKCGVCQEQCPQGAITFPLAAKRPSATPAEFEGEDF